MPHINRKQKHTEQTGMTNIPTANIARPSIMGNHIFSYFSTTPPLFGTP